MSVFLLFVVADQSRTGNFVLFTLSVFHT